MRPLRKLLLCLTLLAFAHVAHADKRLEGIACRSVHLGYPAGEAVAFYNEITIEKSAPGTYFAVCGWNKGYYGLQELANGKKLLIFSVWDSGQNDPNAVAEEQRTKLIFQDEKMRIGRFGGEGTGGQSFYDYDWKIGETYCLMVTSKVVEQRTEYSAYFFVPEENAWKKLVTFSTITGGKHLGGYYSFVEDFKRDRVSATKERQARFGNGWVKSTNGDWVELENARFTADSNPVLNIDAGLIADRFYLVTGGATENKTTRLNETMQRDKDSSLPGDLPTE